MQEIPRFLIHHPESFDVIGLLLVPLMVLVVVALVISAIATLTGHRRHRRRKAVVGGLLAALVAAAVWFYGSRVGIYSFEVRRVEIAFTDLPKAFDGYKIVQFSDAHLGTLTGDRSYILKRAVDSINAQQPDMIAFTGDLQNAYPEEVASQKALLSKLKAKDGVYAVLGNHDYPDYTNLNGMDKGENLGKIISAELDLGWRPLINSHRKIRRGSDSLIIAGLDNDGEGRFPQNGDIVYTLRGLHRDAFVVMLEHDPSCWRRKILPHSQSQLTLSGHTHGGQFQLLGWSPAAMRYSEWSGLYGKGNRRLYVSNGLSGVVPFRFGTPAEIVVFTLRAGKPTATGRID